MNKKTTKLVLSNIFFYSKFSENVLLGVQLTDKLFLLQLLAWGWNGDKRHINLTNDGLDGYICHRTSIVPFHNDIFPGGEQPGHRRLAHEL